MNDVHAFVPCGGEHLAATLTVPDGEAHGIVVLLTGLGAHRNHKFGTWARTARKLADRSIASVRFDYAGVGESTGVLGEWPMTRLPVEQARSVSAFAVRATGATRMVAAGNCVGAWTALMFARAAPECAGVTFISAPVLSSGTGSMARRARHSRVGRLLRNRPSLRRAAAVAMANEPRPAVDLLGAHREVLSRPCGRELMLFGEEDPVLHHRTAAHLDVLRRRLSPQERERLEVRVMPGGSIHGLDSIRAQDFVIEAVTGWATEVLAS